VIGVARGNQDETAAQVRAAGGHILPLAADLGRGTQKEGGPI